MSRLRKFMLGGLILGLVGFGFWSDYQDAQDDPVVTETLCWDGNGRTVSEKFCEGLPLEGGDVNSYHWVSITDRRSEIEREIELSKLR